MYNHILQWTNSDDAVKELGEILLLRKAIIDQSSAEQKVRLKKKLKTLVKSLPLLNPTNPKHSDGIFRLKGQTDEVLPWVNQCVDTVIETTSIRKKVAKRFHELICKAKKSDEVFSEVMRIFTKAYQARIENSIADKIAKKIEINKGTMTALENTDKFLTEDIFKLLASNYGELEGEEKARMKRAYVYLGKLFRSDGDVNLPSNLKNPFAVLTKKGANIDNQSERNCKTLKKSQIESMQRLKGEIGYNLESIKASIDFCQNDLEKENQIVSASRVAQQTFLNAIEKADTILKAAKEKVSTPSLQGVRRTVRIRRSQSHTNTARRSSESISLQELFRSMTLEE